MAEVEEAVFVGAGFGYVEVGAEEGDEEGIEEVVEEFVEDFEAFGEV